jgi:hypothetical protein
MRAEGTISESGIFWDQLLQLIEEQRVVPVVGQDLLTVPGAGGVLTPLYLHFATRLSDYFDIQNEQLPAGAELNEIACRYLAQGNVVEEIYPALKSIAADTAAAPLPAPLLQLAAILPLRLFVSTTFDSMLARALDQVRFGGTSRTQVLSYSPSEVQDLPPDGLKNGVPIVYHLFGKVSATPTYAVTQEDVVEFFHALQSDTRRPPLLFDELNRASLLIIGSSFNGWLARFFMRMARRNRLSSGGRTDYVADSGISSDPGLVLFLRHFSRGTKVYRTGNASEFVQELHARWIERHPQVWPPPSPLPPPRPDVEQGAVFLSYASEDRAAAEGIRTALTSAGIDVFFDRDALQGGDAWDVKLRRHVRNCSIFVPIISRQTLTAERRFFRVEWSLALEEAQMASFSDEESFLVPVVIDDTAPTEPAIPDRFRAHQWIALPGGAPTPEFVSRVQKLYRKYHKAGAR